MVVVMAPTKVAGESGMARSLSCGKRYHKAGELVPVVPGLAAVLVRTARSARDMTVFEVAVAAGCRPGLVGAIEEGRIDPTLDTVGRIVNSIGYELRAGPSATPDPRYGAVDQSEVKRLAAEHLSAATRAAEFGYRPPGPPEGTQPHWDGQHPAPPRLFGAGPSRRDEGGWGAILVSSERSRVGMDRAELAAAAGLRDATVSLIEEGDVVLRVGELQDVLALMGASLDIRLEVYDDHDDVLHLEAAADPAAYEEQMRRDDELLASAVVLD